jgi:ribose/xylose/arabinose/galactoside ABC-type transport system permease subunit
MTTPASRIDSRIDSRFVPLLGTIVVFALTAGYGSVAYKGFFSAQVFLNLLIDNAFLCIVGVGMTFVILSGGIDLSVGAVIALTTMVSAALVEHHHWRSRSACGSRTPPSSAAPSTPSAAASRRPC